MGGLADEELIRSTPVSAKILARTELHSGRACPNRFEKTGAGLPDPLLLDTSNRILPGAGPCQSLDLLLSPCLLFSGLREIAIAKLVLLCQDKRTKYLL